MDLIWGPVAETKRAERGGKERGKQTGPAVRGGSGNRTSQEKDSKSLGAKIIASPGLAGMGPHSYGGLLPGKKLVQKLVQTKFTVRVRLSISNF